MSYLSLVLFSNVNFETRGLKFINVTLFEKAIRVSTNNGML